MKVEFVTDKFLHFYGEVPEPFPNIVETTINNKRAAFILGSYRNIPEHEIPCYFQNDKYLDPDYRTLKML